MRIRSRLWNVVWFVGIAGVLAYFLLPTYLRHRHAEELLVTGAPAQAVVESMHSTHVTVNHNPEVTMELKVEPSGMPPYEAQVTTVIGIGQVSEFQPGKTVQVKYDPKKPTDIAVVDAY